MRYTVMVDTRIMSATSETVRKRIWEKGFDIVGFSVTAEDQCGHRYLANPKGFTPPCKGAICEGW